MRRFLPPGAQQLAIQQAVHGAVWASSADYRAKLRAHMLAELARTAAESGVQLLHQPTEEVVPDVVDPTSERRLVRLHVWTAPYSLTQVWDCGAPHGLRCTPGDGFHGSLCGWRLAPALK